MATAKPAAKKATAARKTTSRTAAAKRPTAVRATAKKAPVAKVAAKKAPVKKATTRRASAKKSTRSSSTNQMRSFHIARDQPPFTTFRITRQTLYWTILVAFIVFAQLWIINLQVEVASLLDAQQAQLQNF